MTTSDPDCQSSVSARVSLNPAGRHLVVEIKHRSVPHKYSNPSRHSRARLDHLIGEREPKIIGQWRIFEL